MKIVKNGLHTEMIKFLKLLESDSISVDMKSISIGEHSGSHVDY